MVGEWWSSASARTGKGDWVSLSPEDGLMDRAEFELDLMVALPAEEENLILELRAADEFGNWNYFRRELGSEAGSKH